MLAQIQPGSGAAQAANPGQVGLFVRDLPSRPYCCDDLGFGLQIRRRDVALSRRYIQHNKPTTVRWLAFDCDYKNALELALERNLPPPNLAILNRKNGHSHLLYSLELGVHRTHSARRKPLWYLAKIEHSLRAELRADPNYVGLVVKNPLHQAWLSYEVRPTSYNLDELADHLTLPARLPVERRSGLGRNCSLFDRLRVWAYRQVDSYRQVGGFTAYKKAVLDQAVDCNDFICPLQLYEVTGIAHSVAKWTWQHYIGKLSSEEFSRLQAARQRRQVEVRNQSSRLKREQAVDLHESGQTQRTIAVRLGVSKTTVNRWVTESKKTTSLMI